MRDDEKENGQPMEKTPDLRGKFGALKSSETFSRGQDEILQESRDKYRLIVENSREGIFVAQNGKIQF